MLISNILHQSINQWYPLRASFHGYTTLKAPPPKVSSKEKSLQMSFELVRWQGPQMEWKFIPAVSVAPWKAAISLSGHMMTTATSDHIVTYKGLDITTPWYTPTGGGVHMGVPCSQYTWESPVNWPLKLWKLFLFDMSKIFIWHSEFLPSDCGQFANYRAAKRFLEKLHPITLRWISTLKVCMEFTWTKKQSQDSQSGAVERLSACHFWGPNTALASISL
jgi:hypothetical protein